jgi:hypothetical protein
MQQNFISVPFKTEGAHGLTTADGIAKFSSAGIILEFETKIIGLVKTGVKEVRLPVGEILDVKFRKGFMKRLAKIEIRMKNFNAISQVPNEGGKITLKLIHDDFERGREAVARLHEDLGEYQELEPFAHTPVSRLFDENEDEDEAKTKEF